MLRPAHGLYRQLRAQACMVALLKPSDAHSSARAYTLVRTLVLSTRGLLGIVPS